MVFCGERFKNPFVLQLRSMNTEKTKITWPKSEEEIANQLKADLTARGISVKVKTALLLEIEITMPVRDVGMKIRVDGFEIVDNAANVAIKYVMPLKHADIMVNRSRYTVTNCYMAIDFDYHGRERKIHIIIGVYGTPYIFDRFDAW